MGDRADCFENAQLIKFCGRRGSRLGRICGFARGLQELTEKPDFCKTRPCRDFSTRGCIAAPTCAYTLSGQELRPIVRLTIAGYVDPSAPDHFCISTRQAEACATMTQHEDQTWSLSSACELVSQIMGSAVDGVLAVAGETHVLSEGFDIAD